jgi:hypothetical protein
MSRIPLVAVPFVVSLFTLVAADAILGLIHDPAPLLDRAAIRRDVVRPTTRNSLGFREREISADLFRNGVRRLLVLGDSFTFGSGVPDDADRFTERLERRLDAESGEGEAFHVFNAGIANTRPADWSGHLEQLLPTYRPHAVFAVFFLRDGTDLCTSLHCWEQVLARLESAYAGAFWYRHSYFGKLVGRLRIERSFWSLYRQWIIDAYSDARPASAWSLAKEHLAAMNARCRAAGVGFHLIVFPILIGLERSETYAFHGVETQILTFAASQGIPSMTLTPGFIGQVSRDLWVAPWDQHPNPKGHALAAEVMLPFVRAAAASRARDP